MKLSPWVFIAIGACLMIIGIGYGVFQQWRPNTRDAETYRVWGEQLAAEEAKMPQAKDRVEKAEAKVMEISDEWQNIVARKTPPRNVEAGGISLTYDRYTLTAKSRTFRENVQRDVNRQVARGGVMVMSGPSVPMPTDDPHAIVASYYNYPAAGFPVAIFDMGQVTVRGTWEEIKNNVQGWSSMPNYLAVADGLAITGTSPHLIGTYNLTIVAFVRGKEMSPEIGSGMASATPQAAGTPGLGGPGMPTPPSGGGATTGGGNTVSMPPGKSGGR